LLAPNVGWTNANGHRLMWTEDNGGHWKDVTPPLREEGEGVGAFFLDTKQGWAVPAYGEPDLGSKFDLARTEDSGATWTINPLTLPIKGSFWGGELRFADSRHGWFTVQSGMDAAARGFGILFVTADGGKTWQLPVSGGGNPAVGEILPRSPLEGWLVDAGGYGRLFVTRDGAKTWRQIDLESPVITDQLQEDQKNSKAFWEDFKGRVPPGAPVAKQPQHDYFANYNLPTFDSATHGYISVTYPGAVVLFETNDDGQTWKPDRVITGVPPDQGDARMVTAMAGSTWVIGRAQGKAMPILGKYDRVARVDDPTLPEPTQSGIMTMSFINEQDGRAFTSAGRLLSTTDSGTAWSDITP
jgi:hypothetical protein